MNPVKAVLFGLLGVAALVLLAVGPRSHVDVPAGDVLVDYWEKWPADEGAQMRQIVDDFNDTVGKRKHIHVRFVSTSNITQKTLVSTAAGVPPDVAGLFNEDLAQFAELDALTPLDELAAGRGIGAGLYKKVYWDGCHYGGHLYCLVSTPAAIALHYNKAAFRSAGLDPDRPPATIAEFDRAAAALDVVDGGHLRRAGYLPSSSWYLVHAHLWFGGSIWDERAHRFTLTDPAVVKAYEWVRSYSRRLGVDKSTEFAAGEGQFDTPQNPFLTGAEAMEQQGPWMANYIDNLKPSLAGLEPGQADDPNLPLADRRARCGWAAAPFPTDVPGLTDVSYCPFDLLCIPRGAKHPAEAFEFIAFVNTQAEMEKLCDLHSKNSPLAAVSDRFLHHHKNPYIDVFERLASSPNARGLPQVPIWPEVAEEMKNLTQRIVLLDVEPAAGLAASQATLQRKYDAFAARQAARRASEAGRE